LNFLLFNNTTKDLKNPSFFEKYYKKIKKPFSKRPKGWKLSSSPRQDEFRNFCMSDEREKVYHKLEEVMIDC